jgi:hypothetical protein
MATLDGIGLAEPSTITKSLAAALIQRNSSNQYQEIMSIGDPDSTTALAIAKVSATVGLASTVMGLAVRIAGGPSSGADLLMRPVFSSTNTDNPVRAILSSTSADNPVTATLASTAMQVQARLTLPTLISLGSTAGTDTTVTLISSAATTPRIVAFHVSSTEAGPIRAGFYAGSTLLWPITLWADGGVVNVSGAVAAPAYLFSGQADRPVQFSASSTGAFFVGLTYFQQ